MINEKRLNQIKILIPQLIEDGRIKKGEEYKEQTNFYLENMEITLVTAQLLYKVSTQIKAKEKG